jgi:hypothetical protein
MHESGFYRTRHLGRSPKSNDIAREARARKCKLTTSLLRQAIKSQPLHAPASASAPAPGPPKSPALEARGMRHYPPRHLPPVS